MSQTATAEPLDIPDPATPDLGALPTWDLGDLYPGQDSDALKADLDRMEKASRDFHKLYNGKLANLEGPSLATAVARYEEIDETLSRIMSYAHLVYAGDMNDPLVGKFFQGIQERVNGISTHLLFFTLELNRIDDAALAAKLKSPELAKYAPWLRDIRVFRPHQLSDELERLLHEKYVVGRAAWNRLFDETIAGLRFTIGGREMTCTEALNRLTDRSTERRREAAVEIGKVLNDNIRTFALITNTLAKDKEIEDKWRDYPRPTSSRNQSNHVEDEVVDALVTAVKGAYPNLSHRYYAMKAKWMGGDTLDYWDRNAPLPTDDDKLIPWNQARGIVLDAYGRFSPELAAVGRRFFDSAWIDAEVRPGKAPGAFAHPTVPSVHPYLLVNYQGKTRDVMTLAHELGHGVHQVLAGKQGHLMADTPLTLAETASVFGEMLTFRSLLDAETDPAAKKIMLASKVEDMLNTVVRQIAFFDFEQRLHTERRQGELTADRIGEIWMEVQTESLGPALRFDDGYKGYWAYIPHFIHSPFYVYAYAFGDCLVNSLYAVYQDASDGFAERYLKMLSAGGTLRHRELLAPFGLDASDPAFWNRGLGVISGFIDELERQDA
ncbi:oligoendopeptidase F [Skermanella stibiiresistens SB22]|uniref:Oligoendopeptidase F n=1 Tax=Skermanella stibiiresistens SB22 TaxID=1385369 RepID=W9GTM8_9PROT|nr:M3 family oligoendopeptidase [Skermanella stibiiresistens]EWY36041.1 oligoendopeptidase F [Skermanella stibiiresistens SB22]